MLPTLPDPFNKQFYIYTYLLCEGIHRYCIIYCTYESFEWI